MADLARRSYPERHIQSMNYRLRRPVLARDRIRVTGDPEGSGAARLSVIRGDNDVTAQGRVTFASARFRSRHALCEESPGQRRLGLVCCPGQNMVLSLAEVSGTGWTTSQCSTTLPSRTRRRSTLASPRSSGVVL